ncbi:MAG: dTMP kinase [Halobacteria archaeon]
MLVTFEGIDGSGKTTLSRRVAEKLKDRNAILTSEPTSFWTGEVVKLAIASKIDPLVELFLFIADHAEHVSRFIRPAINEGKLVISDRYSDSRLAYQGAMLEGVILNPIEWIRSIQDEFSEAPNLTFLLDLEPERALARLQIRDNKTKFEKIELLKKVRENYLSLARREPKRFIVLDATKSIEELEQAVLAEIYKLIARTIGL